MNGNCYVMCYKQNKYYDVGRYLCYTVSLVFNIINTCLAIDQRCFYHSGHLDRCQYYHQNMALLHYCNLSPTSFTGCEFQNLCSTTLTSDRINSPERFQESLIEIAETCIPKTSTRPRKDNPWFNEDCRQP